MREVIPLKERKLDILFVTFFVINFFFISYFVDLEQVVIPDTSDFEYPIWPPKFLVDTAHAYGEKYDPLIVERPVWWRMTIWLDVLVFGPFYAFATYAYVRGREWIRIPSIIWGTMIMTNVTIIMGEEFFGEHATPDRFMVVATNASWFFIPMACIARMWIAGEHPFTREVPGAQSQSQT